MNQFITFLRTNQIHFREMECGTIFVDFRDANKKQEKMITRETKKLGIKIDIADKGVLFS